MTPSETAAYLRQEIDKYLRVIEIAKSEKTDKFAKEKLHVFIEAFDLLDECADGEAVAQKVRELYNAKLGAVDGLRDLLKALGHPVEHVQKSA